MRLHVLQRGSLDLRCVSSLSDSVSLCSLLFVLRNILHVRKFRGGVIGIYVYIRGVFIGGANKNLSILERDTLVRIVVDWDCEKVSDKSVCCPVLLAVTKT